MPRPHPKARDRQAGELGAVTKAYFLDELNVHEAIAALRPPTEKYEYIEESFTFQEMFWDATLPHKKELGVWQRHREALLAEFIERHPGHRPAAWWKYDAPTDADGRRLHPETNADSPHFLFDHGLLTETELEMFTTVADDDDSGTEVLEEKNL